MAASPAQSWTHGSGSLTGKAILDGFNTSSYPFKNFIKGMGSISASGGYAYPANLDANGYPTVGSVTTQFGGTFPKPSTYTGNWRVEWDGKCKIQFAPSQSPNTGFTVISDPGGSVSGSTAFNLNITASGSNFVDVTFNGVGTTVGLNFMTGGDFTGFGNLRMYRISAPYTGDGAAINSGDPLLQFNDDFIASVTALNPQVLRLLDCISVSITNVSRAAYISQPGSITFANPRFVPATWAGDTSGTDTYTCAAAPDTPVTWTDGEAFQVRFVNANTIAGATINVGGRGAKTIYLRFGSAISAGTITANLLATCVYDSVLDKVLLFTGGLTSCWPLSSLVAVCNKVRAGLWYTYSHLFNDASITTVSTYIRDNLTAVYPHYAELCNETWNFTFYPTSLFKNRGAALGWPNANAEQEFSWHGLRHRQVMGIITPIWAGRALKRVMAFQFFGGTTGNNKWRFQGFDLNSTTYPLYGTYTSGVNYDTAPNRPIDYSDVLAYAPYYSGAILRNFDARYTGNPVLTAGNLSALTGAADNYASGVPANIASAFAWVDNDIRAGTSGASAVVGDNTLQNFFAMYAGWEAIAAAYPKAVIGYEGGYEGSYPSTSTCTTLGISTSYGGATGLIAVMLTAYKLNALFKQLVLDQWAQFQGTFPNGGAYTLNGLLPNSSYPAWYSFDAGQWAMTQGNLYTTPFQSYNAFQQFST